jgi:rhomboid family GlyGly-CTERM serine protease
MTETPPLKAQQPPKHSASFLSTLFWGHWHHLLIFCALFFFQFYFSFFFEEEVHELLRYSRTAILLQHDYWRLWSSHFIHLNLNHLLLNAGGLLAIAITFFYEANPKKDIPALFIIITFTSAFLMGFCANIAWYVGLSGVLHGYLAYFLIRFWKEQPFLSFAVLLTLVAKVGWEVSPYADLSATEQLIGGLVAVEAHASGLIAGIITAMGFNIQNKLSTSKTL